jgi:hypothetical protein
MINDKISLGEDISLDSATEYMSIQDGRKDGLDTLVTIQDKRTGEVVFKGKNRTMISGSEFMAYHVFRLNNFNFTTPTYNTQIGLDHTVSGSQNDLGSNYVTQVFCVGTSGCNRESAIWYPVSNKKWIAPSELVPFQYVPSNKDLTALQRETYFGRKEMGNQYIAYYFKKFDSNPIYKKQYEDGTPWNASIFEDNSEANAQMSVTTTMTITKDDCRDFFINTTGINDGRFNCLSLCLAWTDVYEGFTYYQDIRPLTRINFPNKFLNDLTSEWLVTYHIYF